jgi:hypothetical protein
MIDLKRKIKYIIYLVLFPKLITAQFGGWNSFSFLKMPSDAYTTALGGQQVAPIVNDPSLFLNNPAINDSIKKHFIKINFAPLWAGTNTSTIVYGRNYKKYGNILVALQYINYGTFQGTDPAGNLTSTFTANDFAFTIGHSQKINNISIGANIKLAGSTIESYSAYAILVDFGGYFKHPTKDISYGLSIKNMGARIKNFYSNDAPDLPFDVQMGFTIRPEQMPFRFSINAHHIHQWNIAINKPVSINIINNQIIDSSVSTADKIARHLVFGIETFVQKNIQLNLGYNQLLRKELKQQDISTLSGFSFGFLMKTKKLNFAFGHQGFNTAGGLNQFSVLMPLK